LQRAQLATQPGRPRRPETRGCRRPRVQLRKSGSGNF
jgi:hypothetical protein